MGNLRIEYIGEMDNEAPDVPLADGVDISNLRDDEKPYTLRIGKVGAISKNKARNGKPRRYGQAFYQSLVREINDKRPEGIWGHPDLAGKMHPLEYVPPAVRWVGAVMDEAGEVWGKVIPVSQEAKDYLRIAKASKAPVATSYVGLTTFAGEEGVEVDLRRLDMAPVSNPGVQDAISRVFVSEMEEPEGMAKRTQNQAEVEEPVVEVEEAGEVTEVENEGNTYQERVGELEARVAELEPVAGQIAQIRELVGEASVLERVGIEVSDDVIATLKALIGELSKKDAVEFLREAEEIVAEMVALEAARPIVLDMLNLPSMDQVGEPQLVAEMFGTYPDRDSLREKVKGIVARPHMAAMLKAMVGEAAGPSAVVGEQGPDPVEEKKQKLVEEAEQIAKEWGAD